jgi:hypothetical protein
VQKRASWQEQKVQGCDCHTRGVWHACRISAVACALFGSVCSYARFRIASKALVCGAAVSDTKRMRIVFSGLATHMVPYRTATVAAAAAMVHTWCPTPLRQSTVPV